MSNVRKTGLFPGLITAAIVVLALPPAGLADKDAADVLIPRHSRWKYFTGSAELPATWNHIDFDDTLWNEGEAGFGYGDDDDRTVFQNMRGRFRSVYIRRTFDVADPQQITSLYLYLNYDDGFIAWLNGKPLTAAAASRVDGRLKVDLHEAGQFERFHVSDAGSLLQKGTNVLAIEGHNASLNSSDFSLDPVLTAAPLNRPITLFEAADFLADLDEFERRLLDQSSYLTRRKFDSAKAIDELRRSINSQTSLTEFILRLRKVVMQIGDCHASVRGNTQYALHGFLPFRVADTQAGLAALKLNEDELLNPDHPWIDSLDGIPLQQWIDCGRQFVPYGSPQLRYRRAVENLAYFDMFRDELGVSRKPVVDVTFRSADGRKQSGRTLRLTQQRFSVATVKLRGTRLLEDNIGYLRIPVMDSRLADSLVKQIFEFRSTRGMIIDVRENGGGTYHILRAIYPFFCPPHAGPRVTNAAVYRLSRQFRPDHLAYRPTHRLSWDGWNDQEREVIRAFQTDFRPEWVPPAGQFSDWHYMLLNRRRSWRDKDRDTHDYFHYDRPVAVLSSAGSFSATDGFLSAFADLPQVTIVGEPSAGGSGARRRFELPRTHVVVSLSSMASFRAGGKLFDGNGVEVDIEVSPTPDDYTQNSDSVLARAIRVIHDQL